MPTGRIVRPKQACLRWSRRVRHDHTRTSARRNTPVNEAHLGSSHRRKRNPNRLRLRLDLRKRRLDPRAPLLGPKPLRRNPTHQKSPKSNQKLGLQRSPRQHLQPKNPTHARKTQFQSHPTHHEGRNKPVRNLTEQVPACAPVPTDKTRCLNAGVPRSNRRTPPSACPHETGSPKNCPTNRSSVQPAGPDRSLRSGSSQSAPPQPARNPLPNCSDSTGCRNIPHK